MKKILIFAFLIMFLPLSVFAFQQSVEEIIKRGDDLAAEFDHTSALNEYKAALEVDSDCLDAAWKASRELAAIGNNLEKAEAEKEEIEAAYAEAVEYAQNGIELDSESADSHFSLAVAKGRLGLYRGKKEMIRLSKDVKIHVDIVLNLDPNHYKAHYLLGRWHDKIANVNWFLKKVAKIIFGGLPPANNEEAQIHYKKAIELNPEYVECHKELGRFYMDRKEWKSAVEVLEICTQLPESQEHDASYKEEAVKFLEKARKKVD